MPGRERVPSFQIASGTTNERDNSYNISTGSIFYNTDTGNVEIRHEDPNNSVDWRDFVVNNKEQIDISGKLVVKDDVSFNAHLNVGGKLVVKDDVSFNAHLNVGGNLTVAQASPGFLTSKIVASGGDSSYTNSVYKVHKFTSNGNLTVSVSGWAYYVMVGGGGSGGTRHQGGGGGGGVLHGFKNFPGGNTTFAIGGSSVAPPPPSTGPGGNGNITTMTYEGTTITALGGGGGGVNTYGTQVGSTGGRPPYDTNQDSEKIRIGWYQDDDTPDCLEQGFPGGKCQFNFGNPGTGSNSSGGGGAGGEGGMGGLFMYGGHTSAGTGGQGKPFIGLGTSDETIYLAGGGGGCQGGNGWNAWPYGSGGCGGGGNGSKGSPSNNGGNYYAGHGGTNTGGGGGSGSFNGNDNVEGGYGGSGVVYIYYPK